MSLHIITNMSSGSAESISNEGNAPTNFGFSDLVNAGAGDRNEAGVGTGARISGTGIEGKDTGCCVSPHSSVAAWEDGTASSTMEFML